MRAIKSKETGSGATLASLQVAKAVRPATLYNLMSALCLVVLAAVLSMTGCVPTGMPELAYGDRWQGGDR